MKLTDLREQVLNKKKLVVENVVCETPVIEESTDTLNEETQEIQFKTEVSISNSTTKENKFRLFKNSRYSNTDIDCVGTLYVTWYLSIDVLSDSSGIKILEPVVTNVFGDLEFKSLDNELITEFKFDNRKEKFKVRWDTSEIDLTKELRPTIELINFESNDIILQ